MKREELEKRTKKFHIDIIGFCTDFPRTHAGFEIAKQLIRSAGSVGANYRASGRAKSIADFINKIQIIIEEADESKYWLEVILESKLKSTEEAKILIKEANELTAIFAASNKTAKANRNNV
ncbi:four helix bundle protein [Ferruginibacter sp. HRS2-29]|uniref:four helix bundle protein n=1 Tax=Ferruginibacter sp. HRS2-29 TaxID=2487334 RepID=UPI0020CC97B5|nr:four helix bundle protein [Ferruginibacter sp. HRS2-29]MCP9750117.1 four helix bundle protein [Ferruginibacter sp. HRS2-29]